MFRYLAATWCSFLLAVTAAVDVTPQYIFNPNQPPEFPDCDAKYAGVCAVQIAIGLVESILGDACASLGGGGTAASTALQKIQSGHYLKNTPGTNFGVIVLERSTGKSLVDTLIPSNVNATLDDKTVYGEVHQPTLLKRIQDAVDGGGRFVPFHWRWTQGGAVAQALLYVRRCTSDTGHMIGVIVGREPLPQLDFSSANSISFGTIANVRRVVGRCTLDILAANTKKNMEDVFHDITYTNKYTVPGGFYIFMYKVGTQNSPGLEAVGDTKGINVAHNVIHRIIGWNISAFRTHVGASQGLIDQGHVLDLALANAAVTGGQWVDYLWGPLSAPYYKLSYTVGVKVDGTKYYLGSGFKMVPDPQVKGPSCATCSAGSNMPCTTKNALIVVSSALAKILTNLDEHTAFNVISTDATYKANDGFYVFAFNYNGTCVADGSDISNVGKKLSDMTSNTPIDGGALNDKFVAGANLGGTWVKYEWQDSSTSAKYSKIAYVVKLYKYQRYFYLGVAFKDAAPPKKPSCPADYAEPCAEFNLLRVVGSSNTALLTAASQGQLDDAMIKIAKKEYPFADQADGYAVSVYTNSLACPSALKASNNCPPVLTDEERLSLAPVVAARGGWTRLGPHPPPSSVGPRMAYALPVTVTLPGVDELVLISTVKDNRLPRCDGGCPSSSTCVSGRCECNFGWRANYSEDTTACGDLKSKLMSCVDDSIQSCTAEGMGRNAANGVCEACKPGSHKPTSLKVKNSPCLACQEGRFSNVSKALSCTSCPVGKFGKTPGGTGCQPCAPGSFAAKEGTVECVPCAAGTFADGNGYGSCNRCPVGKFSSTTGASACEDCQDYLKKSTTSFQGATLKSDCVCKVDAYNGLTIHGKAECLTCGEGLSCPESNTSLPNQDAGYYIHNNQPSDVYRCEPEDVCVGAAWGKSACRSPRFGFMCMECPEGMVRNNNFEQNAEGCKECSPFTSIIVAIVPLCAFVCCVTIMYFTHDSPLNESPLTMEVQNTVGQLVMFFQVSNAIFATQMLYGEPMDGFMDRLITHLDPDAVFSNAACLQSKFTGPVLNYSVVIICPVAFMIVLAAVYTIAKVAKPRTIIFSLESLLNIWGEVLVEFYIAITLAIFAPFQCFKHPNGKSSVLSYSQVICGDSDWNSMVGLAVFGIIAYPLMAMVVSSYMTWRHPKAMLNNDLKLLVKGRFLFDRWTPSCYWFCNVSLIRNFLIAVLPCVMPQDQLDVTILLMTLVLIWALVMLVWFKPRRTPGQQKLDTFVSIVQITVLSFGVTSAHGDPLRESLSTACVILITAVVLSIIALLIFRLQQLLMKAISYNIYLSHHCGNGGTSTRILQRVLMQRMKIFYDVDYVGFMGLLFDAARVSDNILVSFAGETFCRPWCIAAIVCAYRRGTPLHRVIFENPRVEETVVAGVGTSGHIKKTLSGKYSKKKNCMFEVDTYSLRGYGLNQDDVHPAIQALTAVDSNVMSFLNEQRCAMSLESMLNNMAKVRALGFQVDDLFRACNKSVDFRQGKVPRTGISFVMIDHLDGEAVSVSRLLTSTFSRNGDWLEDQDLSASDFANLVKNGNPLNAVFVFSQNTLSSASQLARMGLLHKTHNEMHIVPVAAGTTLEFPDDDYITALEVGTVLELGSDTRGRLSALAGSDVSLPEVKNGLLHVMNFTIVFANIAAIPLTSMPKVLNDVITRATGSGRRASFSKETPSQPSEQVPAGGGGGFGGGGGGSATQAAALDNKAAPAADASPDEIAVTEV